MMFHTKPPKTIIIPALAAALLALALIPFSNSTAKIIHEFLVDLPMSAFFYFARHLTGEIYIALVILAVWFYRKQYRATLISFLLALALSGLINETIKVTARRVRPKYTVLADTSHSDWVLRFMKKHPDASIRPEAKDQWLTMDFQPGFLDDHFQSFPSGHANLAFVMAAYLVMVFPRGRIIWLLLAVFCALARVRLRRHFLEDVIFGGALGWLIAHWVFTWRWPLRLGDAVVKRIVPEKAGLAKRKA